MDTHREIWQKVSYDILRIGDDEGTRQKFVMQKTEASRQKTHF
jgi:hypothetical protein